MALVEAARFSDSFAAGLARARLEASGIDSVLFGLNANPVFAGSMYTIQLMVDDEDLGAARALLSEEEGDGSR